MSPFSSCRSLSCQRITLHKNLFFSFVLNSVITMIWLTGVANNQELVQRNPVSSCIYVYILHYKSSTFFLHPRFVPIWFELFLFVTIISVFKHTFIIASGDSVIHFISEPPAVSGFVFLFLSDLSHCGLILHCNTP